MIRVLAAVHFLIAAFATCAQTDSSWTVLVLRHGKTLELKQDMASFSNTGFYLYRNCVYTIGLKDKREISGRLISVTADTLLFTNFFNVNEAYAAKASLDTLRLHYRQLDKLKLIGDRALGLYVTHDLDHYDFIFKKDTLDRFFESEWAVIYNNDPARYELVAHLTGRASGYFLKRAGEPIIFMAVT